MSQQSLWQDFPANRFPQQEKDSVPKTTAMGGQTVLEQFGRFARNGAFSKTFAALLIGMEGWYSTKCRLIWKMKATKSHRFYFQLVPSMLPIEGTEFGLLPTPVVMDSNTGDLEKIDQRRIRAKESTGNGNGFGQTIGELANRGMPPTPVSSDAGAGAIIGKNDIYKETSGLPRKINQNGTDGSVGLGRLVQLLPTPQTQGLKECDQNGKTKFMDLGLLPTPRANQVNGCDLNNVNIANRNKGNLEETVAKWVTQGMLPTPMASDYGEKVTGLENQDSLVKRAREITGQTSQLNPLFVNEMMGFPIGWLDI